jgi:O-antigen/teichoic acid export membrane protein
MAFAWSSRGQRDGVAVPLQREAAKEGGAPSHSESARGVFPFYFAANMATRAAMLIVLIVLTRLLSRTEYGLFALVVTTGEILEMASSNWIRIYLLRTESGAKTLRARRLGRALVLSAGGALVALAAAMLVVPFIGGERTAETLLAVCAYIGAFAILRMMLMLAQLSRSHRSYVGVECGRSFGVVAATVCVAMMQPHSFLPASLALSLVTAGSATLGLLFTARGLVRPSFPRGGYLVALAFGAPYVLTNTLYYTIGWFDRFIVNYFLGPGAVGVYVATYSIARQPVDLFTGGLNSLTFPMLMRAYADGGAAKAGPIQAGVMTTMAVLGMGVVAGLSLLAEPLATLLFPPSYRADVSALIPWIAIATFMLSLRQFVFENSLHATRQNLPLLLAMIPAAVVSIWLGILLVRGHGLFGAAINYLVVCIVALFSAAIISFRMFSFAIPWRNLAKVALAALVATAAAWTAIRSCPCGALPILLVGAAVFCAVYGALLTLLGFSLWRLIETPWAPLGDGERMSSNSAR